MRRSIALVLTCTVAAAAGVLATGCNRGDKPDGTYTVRGEVKSLQTARHGEVLIHHEAIPTFVGRDGQQKGMMSMSMPFGVTRAVSLDGFSAGDKVQIQFEVYWEATPPIQIISMEKLPPDTALDLTGL